MAADYHPFPDTHWSLVHRAGNRSAAEYRDSLRVLLHRYEPALRSYLVRVRGILVPDAEDLVQSFVADKILEQQLLRHADERRGRFRGFLLTCLNNFVRTHRRSQQVRPFAVLEEAMDQPSPAAQADHALEADWVRSLLNNVLDAMRDECERTQRMDVWAVFDRRILATLVRDEPPQSYEQLASFGSPAQAANLLVTAKRMYARLLRRAIAEYEGTDEAIEQEIADLRAILSRSTGTDDGRID